LATRQWVQPVLYEQRRHPVTIFSNREIKREGRGNLLLRLKKEGAQKRFRPRSTNGKEKNPVKNLGREGAESSTEVWKAAGKRTDIP